jgi:hypothetical protein
MKSSDADLPRYAEVEGIISEDYRDHNGRIRIGSGEWTFETAWSSAGNGSIYAYNDPPSIKGVAVAPSATSIEQITEDVFVRANFTSRVRHPRVGQVVLFENSFGYAAAIELRQIRLTEEGASGTVLEGRYKILTNKEDRDFSGNKIDPIAELQAAATDALGLLAQAGTPQGEIGRNARGIGHNKPPTEHALTADEIATVSHALREIVNKPDKQIEAARLDEAERQLGTTVEKIQTWASRRLSMFEEGFFRQLGATAAIALLGLGFWMTLAGKLQVVVSAIQKALPFLPALP